MTHILSWPEWFACLLALAAVVWPVRALLLTAFLSIIAAGISGTAGMLLVPAAVGTLSVLLLLKSGSGWRTGSRLLGVGSILFSALLCVTFPVPEAPRLTGSHAVGTLSVELPSQADSPALVTQIWYPSLASGGVTRAPWLPDPALAPDVPFHRIAHAFANSVQDADLLESDQPLPVIFYEHSWTGHRAENVAQGEALASHGFVVVAIDHPQQAEQVRLADGTVVSSRLPAQLDLSTEKAVSDFENLAEECLDKRINEIGRIRRALADGAVPRLAGKLTLENVGIFGFSFGGSCALRISSQDPSFVAGANEDGFFLGNETPPGPFLFFDQEMPAWLQQPPSTKEGPAEALTRRSELRIQAALGKPDRERVIIEGTRHESFCDRIFTCRIPRLARTGTRPAAELHQTITSRLVGFFATHLPETPGIGSRTAE